MVPSPSVGERALAVRETVRVVGEVGRSQLGDRRLTFSPDEAARALGCERRTERFAGSGTSATCVGTRRGCGSPRPKSCAGLLL